MNYEEIFSQRDVDDDTKILSTRFFELDGVPILLEDWYWDGVTASSCVVPVQFIEDQSMTTDTMINKIKSKFDITDPTTQSQNGSFLFLNFNFKIKDAD